MPFVIEGRSDSVFPLVETNLGDRSYVTVKRHMFHILFITISMLPFTVHGTP